MAVLCKAPTKSAGIGLSIMAVCKNSGKKTLGQDDFFVMVVHVVRGKVTVILDGGVQRGTYVFKALALGAQAVLVSSPPQTINSCY